MSKIKVVLAGMMFVWVASCTTVSPATPTETRTKNNEIDAISNTADLQMTFIKQGGSKDRFCGARPGDVADSSSSGASVFNVSEGSTQGSLSLGGRTPAVLIVREMLYRACEVSININTDFDQTMKMYQMFLDETKEMISTQTSDGQAAIGQESTAVVTISETGTVTESKTSESTSSTTTGSE